MSFWSDYESRLTINGNTQRDHTITIAKESFINQIGGSPAYRVEAKNNGVSQPLLLQAKKDTSYKADIIAMPGDSMCIGDLIENEGEHWLVVETNTTNPIQVTGTAWLCNQLFKFQNGTTTIIEKYGVFDDGTYSKSSDDQIVTLDNKTGFYLPYDDDTKFIYVDKRLATDVVYNESAKEELLCWNVTSVSSKAKNYGTGSHLLNLEVESSGYDATTDSLEEMVCNFISEDSGGSTGELLPCSITTARSRIFTGTSYTYIATFYQADGVTVNDSVNVAWTVDPIVDGVTSVPNGNSIKISVADNDDLVGSTFTISVTDDGGLYNTATYEVEVV